jgi:hypothetical protein
MIFLIISVSIDSEESVDVIVEAGVTTVMMKKGVKKGVKNLKIL